VAEAFEMLDGWNEFVSSGAVVAKAYYRNPDLGR